MTVQINAGDKNPAYATYVGRVGALAVALGIGAAIATGHGLGVGVAYATEGDPDSSQDGDTNDNDGGDTGATASTPPSTAPVAPTGSSQNRSPLARIASVPKMIFNATGGAQRSSTATSTNRARRSCRTCLKMWRPRSRRTSTRHSRRRKALQDKGIPSRHFRMRLGRQPGPTPSHRPSLLFLPVWASSRRSLCRTSRVVMHRAAPQSRPITAILRGFNARHS